VSKINAKVGRTPSRGTVIAQCKKPTAQTAHLVFLTLEPTLKKPKEQFFANARTETENELNN